MGVKQFLKENTALLAKLFHMYSVLLGVNKIKGKAGNQLIAEGAFLKRCRIQINGMNNQIVVEDLAQLQNCMIYIQGNGNQIHIGKSVSLNYAELWIEDNDNRLQIEDGSSADGKKQAPVHMAVIEGTSIILGKDCMLSSGIEIRTGDSHSIVNNEGERINPSKEIVVGNHVWIGTRAMLLKGSRIADDCIVGAGSMVTGSFDEAGCALAGNPAKVLRKDVSWKRERI